MSEQERVIQANGEPLTLPPAPEPAMRKGGRPRKVKAVEEGVMVPLAPFEAEKCREGVMRPEYEHDALWVRKHDGDSPAEPPAPGLGGFAKATAHMGAAGWRLVSVVDETRYIDHKHIRGWMTFWERVKL